ncbi:MAG: Pseudaminic acid biosynthesis protein PseA, putative Pse5Ac7Ac acetamidino synthase [Cyanobacteria bacterium RYN_339]|nr:Pseudaminic acid biosynthesis protein PseA, putative Pse5Ac7Ac acetamidino synthase [Cyanobacteria bacterium RYN_339]
MSKPIRYCTSCVMPETKPDLQIDEQGVCSACNYYKQRKEVDWEARKQELLTLLERYRDRHGNNYDCIVPVSGGKDSTFQLIQMKQLGLNPIAVTASTDKLAAIGRRNLDNIRKLGVDHIEVTVNPRVRARINRLALEEIGDISWPEHVLIFTVPVRMAVQLNVPLIMWGENSQNEYGGPAAAAENNTLTRRWLEEFGGLLGLRVSDLVDQGIERRSLIQYTYPTDEDLQRVGVTGLFLGHYLPWDGLRNSLLAQAHGFETYHKPVEGSLVNYENLDNCHTGIHDYFKFLKFGFGRATDLACLHVRRGRLTRDEAIELVQIHDGKFPWEYLGCKLEEVLEDLDMTTEQFIKVCDRFTNKRVFLTDARGNLVKDRHGNLTKVNYDNAPAVPV